MSSNQAQAPRVSSSSWERNLSTTFAIETWFKRGLAFLSSIPILITLSITVIFLLEAFLFFQEVPIWKFLTDTQWTASFSGPNVQYGIFVLASATLMVTVIATVTAVPIGIMGAIFLAEYADPNVRRFLKPALEAISGIPTVVLGYFTLLFFTPILKEIIPGLSTFNSLSAGLVVGILITPTISSLSEDALRSVPSELRDGGYALGFTKSEMIIKVLLSAASPGIIAAITLAVSQALGETMIVAIAAGQNPSLTLNPLVPVMTMTTFIIQISLGRVEFNSTLFHTIFTLGAILFLMTFALNTFGNWLTRRSEEEISGILTPKAQTEEAERTTEEEIKFTHELAERAKNVRQQMSSQPNRLLRERLFWVLALIAALTGIVVLVFLSLNLAQRGLPQLNWEFLTSYSSRKPEESGILAPLFGSLWLFILTAILIIPVGIGAAIYLEEYFPDNWLSRVIEIDIANLAAVPPIIYGLLGLELFVHVLQPITGGNTTLAAGLTLAVIVLPTVIIASRSALRNVPESVRQGGSAVGMTKGEMLRYLVIPAAFPRLITGVLLALSQALGETAALLAVGAVATASFVPDLKSQFIALPVQIYYWLQEPSTEVQNNAATATIVLIVIVLFLNVAAVFLRDFYHRELTS